MQRVGLQGCAHHIVIKRVIYILKFETNIFCNLRQISFAIWDKYILQFETNTFCNLKQIHLAIWYKFILQLETIGLVWSWLSDWSHVLNTRWHNYKHEEWPIYLVSVCQLKICQTKKIFLPGQLHDRCLRNLFHFRICFFRFVSF